MTTSWSRLRFPSWWPSADKIRRGEASNFIILHYAYFIVVVLITAVIFWGSSTPSRSISFTDALFFTASAMTEAGLNTINLSALNTFQQGILFVLIIIGSSIFVSAFTVHIRLRAFEKEFATHERRLRTPRRRRTIRSRPEPPGNDTFQLAQPKNKSPQTMEDPDVPLARTDVEPQRPVIDVSSNTLGFSRGLMSPTSPTRRYRRMSNDFGRLRRSSMSISLAQPRDVDAILKSEMVSFKHAKTMLPEKASRNSQFHNLTPAERRELGGAEYQAILLLAYLVPIYLVLWQFLGALSLAAWVAHYRTDTTRANGLDPWWVGAFNAISAFNNSGMSLLDANMVAFQSDIFMLLSMGLFILAGNTAYPIFLRIIVWTMWKLLPGNSKWDDARNTLRFLLDHPRRCYTNMFPSRHTWWLGFALIALNGIDWAAFEVLSIGNRNITSLKTGTEVVDGLFQALAVRSGGFYVVNIPQLRISLQVLYVVMMYIGVYPVALSIRNSNVYEERSLGIFNDQGEDDTRNDDINDSSISRRLRRITGAILPMRNPESAFFLQQQLRAQLAYDVWWLALAVFLITIIEGSQIEANPASFSVFNIIFEVVSGYGTVGISVGVPNAAYSFCGSWHALSKLVLIFVMIRGRHRGLPVAIDYAVHLPGDAIHKAEDGRTRSWATTNQMQDWAAAV